MEDRTHHTSLWCWLKRKDRLSLQMQQAPRKLLRAPKGVHSSLASKLVQWNEY